jgi:hypothetical protein
MPRFYFDLSNGHRLRDHAGLDCDSENDAKRKAEVIADDIGRQAHEIPKKHLTVVDEKVGTFTRRRFGKPKVRNSPNLSI